MIICLLGPNSVRTRVMKMRIPLPSVYLLYFYTRIMTLEYCFLDALPNKDGTGRTMTVGRYMNVLSSCEAFYVNTQALALH